MKRCTGCKELLSEDKFYKKSGTKDGLRFRCKVCEYKEQSPQRKAKEYRVKVNAARKIRRHQLGVSKSYYEVDKEGNKYFVNLRPPRLSKSKYKSRGKEYGEDWIEIRKIIYERDNWVCQECGRKCHGNGTKDKIQCHHIDYNIMNNIPKNLITLCASCHAKTNFKKSDWFVYYNNKIQLINKRKA